ncbi:winged helix-turn-helix domain-containing protein [Ornithinimicrobium sp. F0845]|uniref:winged helix-turn-helix domain-containing protein n=1 Tax=Ornithinimicrobium sp. F0845 TaxID=2926412 RepID=UPI001FF30473|nr:winged helix-turn-helix domain-containing protein [Ornithinimicrobium sp. F0845]MCK0113703.1 winged helix-turn-helix domain-containing protein [Ornithinimicrobium sp. F0845]
MGQAAAVTDPVLERGHAARSSALVVLVAPDEQHRASLLAQLDPSAAVLVVPSVAMAQQVMAPEGPPERGSAPDGGADSQLTVHEDRHAIEFGQVEVSLTPLEFALLRQLIREPGRVWRYDELVRQVWGTDHLGDASQVHAVVKRLRAKLGREHAPVIIEAVRGVGFRALRDQGAGSGRPRTVRPARP